MEKKIDGGEAASALQLHDNLLQIYDREELERSKCDEKTPNADMQARWKYYTDNCDVDILRLVLQDIGQTLEASQMICYWEAFPATRPVMHVAREDMYGYIQNETADADKPLEAPAPVAAPVAAPADGAADGSADASAIGSPGSTQNQADSDILCVFASIMCLIKCQIKCLCK